MREGHIRQDEGRGEGWERSDGRRGEANIDRCEE